MDRSALAATQVAGRLNSLSAGMLGAGEALRSLGSVPESAHASQESGEHPAVLSFGTSSGGQNSGWVHGRTDPAGSLPGGHVYAPDEPPPPPPPPPEPPVVPPEDDDGDTVETPRKHCCCILKNITIVAEEDEAVVTPSNDSPHAKAIAAAKQGTAGRITVRVEVDFRKDSSLKKDLPCLLQWWEKTNIPYSLEPIWTNPDDLSDVREGRPMMLPGKWTDLSRTPLDVEALRAWRKAMNQPVGGAEGSGNGTIACVKQTIALVDRPIWYAPSGTMEPVERRLQGQVTVYSGCPEGPMGTKSWWQGVDYWPGAGYRMWLYPPASPGQNPFMTSMSQYIEARFIPDSVGAPPTVPNPADQVPPGEGGRSGTTSGPGATPTAEQQKQAALPSSDNVWRKK